ncbi:hypothetical protein C1H69_10020 [Billgrantia endophytica]|uniref:Uncharacterized protein n=1 Tax=Billgrantia endophytica TaxID=2033802 RepID=A0A2N7U536_9GAMM|nr:hypothetical protein C1H69_10020 [Halomonas endophytica]
MIRLPPIIIGIEGAERMCCRSVTSGAESLGKQIDRETTGFWQTMGGTSDSHHPGRWGELEAVRSARLLDILSFGTWG